MFMLIFENEAKHVNKDQPMYQMHLWHYFELVVTDVQSMDEYNVQEGWVMNGFAGGMGGVGCE